MKFFLLKKVEGARINTRARFVFTCKVMAALIAQR